MRKDLDLAIEAEIRLDLAIDDDRVAELVERHTDYLEEEVRAGDRGAVENGHRRTWDVEGVEVEIGIEPRGADRREAPSQASSG